MENEMDLLELLEELKGTTCRCGKRKTAMQTFCKRDYYRLPRGMQQALYNRVGEGYEQAYSQAVEYLDEQGA